MKQMENSKCKQTADTTLVNLHSKWISTWILSHINLNNDYSSWFSRNCRQQKVILRSVASYATLKNKSSITL